MASTYLTRTPSLAGNRKTFTLSMWVKTSNTSFQYLAGSINGGGNYSHIGFTGNTTVRFFQNSPNAVNVETNQLLRDPSAWYHIVYSVDTTQATSADRIKIYVNGTEATYASTTYPSQNLDMNFNEGSVAQGIGCRGDLSGAFNGSMAHVHFTDGTAYDASTFGETDATTGIWKPKTAPSVTYGTNGFFLKFENSGAFGTDSSGNANNFTVNGTMTQTIDTPSNVFATFNPLDASSSGTFSNGNNTYGVGSATWCPSKSTLAFSNGKYYCEAKGVSGTNLYVGVYDVDVARGSVQSEMDNNRIVYVSNGDIQRTLTGNSGVTGLATYTTSDIIGCAVDKENGTVKFYKNGTLIYTETDSSVTNKTLCFGTQVNNSTLTYNFGNGYFGTTAVSSAENPDDGIGIFEYDVPTGYRALCTKSINAQEYD
jgi:hypothetical protein